MPSFDSNIQFVHFPAKDARACVYFPPNILYFVARIAFLYFLARIVFLVFIVKDEPSLCKKGFEDKKRIGRPKVLTEAAKKVLKKAKYKKGKFDEAALTTVSKQRPCWGKNTVWRFMKSEGCRPLRRLKKLHAHCQATCSSCEIC